MDCWGHGVGVHGYDPVDRETFEKARMLKGCITDIRQAYTNHYTNGKGETQLLALATYFIDRFSMSTASMKEYKQLTAFGCFAMKFWNIKTKPPTSLRFGCKDLEDGRMVEVSVKVDPPIYDTIVRLRAEKCKNDFLLDKLDAVKLNSYLNELMTGLTFEVFHAYNVSVTFERVLSEKGAYAAYAEHFKSSNSLIKRPRMHKKRMHTLPLEHFFADVLNEVRAIIYDDPSHRTISKRRRKKAVKKITELEGILEGLGMERKRLKGADGQPIWSSQDGIVEKKIAATNYKIRHWECFRDLPCLELPMGFIQTEWYIDPRIVVAWCKKTDLPIEMILGKVHSAKCAWAMSEGPDFRF